MDIIVEEERLGSVGKTQRIKISRRDTMVNDLKNSTVQGILSFIVSLAALAAAGVSVFLSYRAAGRADYIVGILMIVALLLAVFSIVLGTMGLKNRKKIRHYMEVRGIVVSVILILALIGLYVWGLLMYLGM